MNQYLSKRYLYLIISLIFLIPLYWFYWIVFWETWNTDLLSSNNISSWENSSNTQFKITDIKIIDDRNFLINFSLDLAKEPLNLELLDLDWKTIYVNSVEIGSWLTDSWSESNYLTWSRMEVHIFTASKLEINKQYFVVIKNARSMNWDIIEQDKKEIMLDNNIQESQSIKTSSDLSKNDITKINESLKQDKQLIDNLNKLSVDNIKANSNKKVLPAHNNSNPSNIQNNNITNSNIKRLPKTWPELYIILILSFVFAWIFLFKKQKK